MKGTWPMAWAKAMFEVIKARDIGETTTSSAVVSRARLCSTFACSLPGANCRDRKRKD